MASSASYDVAVIGLGAMGSAALYQLSRRSNLKIIAFERETPGHDGGSSHGESRIIRRANFENPDSYGPLIELAFQEWDELARVSGKEIILRTGVTEMGHAGSLQVKNSIQAAKNANLDFDELSAEEIRSRFKAFDVPNDWKGVFQKDGGILKADVAITAFIEQAKRNSHVDVRLRTSVLDLKLFDGSYVIRDRRGGFHTARSVIVTAGPWMARQLPLLGITLPLTISRQIFGWYRVSQTSLMRDCPIYVFEFEDGLFYGFSDFLDSGMVKIASHIHGDPVTNRNLNGRRSAWRKGSNSELASLDAQISARLRGVGELLFTKTCLYTNTPDEEFIIDRHPIHPGVVLVSACSGHGFKFASAIGKIAADMAEEIPIDSALRMDTYSLKRPTLWC